MTRHLYLLMTILMVLSAVACDGDGGSSIDVQIDENVDDDGNNGLDDDNNQTGQRPCGDVPHEGVIDEGEAGECGGFVSECEIKGVAVRVALVCDDGQEVEIAIEEACERDTNGLIVDEGEASECDGFDDACDETGLTQRTQVVCQGGTAVEEVVEEECERDTDGVVVEEGDAGECGGFEDTCDETGIQTRTDVVCQDGQQAEVTQDVECERDTDGVVIEEGQFGECEGFEDACDESGARTQVTVVCRGGQQAEESLTQPCERDTDGIVLEEGQAGECGGFEGVCDQTGTAERTDTVCQDGEAAALAVAVDCERNTNGQVVRQGELGQCGGFEGACDEEGQAQRTDVVCQDGQETEVTAQQACERDTDGVVVEEGDAGECGGFEDVCDEDGTAQRTDVVCQGGQETDVTNTVECSRDTDRLVVDEGEFGQCGGFEGPCATDGVQRRTQTICQDGQPTQEEDFQDCQRDTDGVVVEEGELGVCSGFEGICDETGTQRQTNTVCENGAPTAQDVTVECERDTDGVIVEEGQVGECGGFEGTCGEEGVAQVTGVVCRDGQETEATTEQACFRDTDGVVVRAGEFGQCGGFEGACGEDGVQERTDIVCDGGQETERTERQDCQRDTDGVIVDEGQFGQCGGFENDCDEDGVQVRTQVVCEAGQESRREIEQVCTRETDGLIISEDDFGACEGFESACDETGVQRRRNIECQDGQEVGQVETRDCTRDTDGVIVDEGQFGRCGGFEGVCDEDGVQVRQETFCQGGQEAQREIEQACGRDTDGVVVLVGEPGECGGFEGVCGEDGVQERTDIVCDGGQETERTERQDCERDTDGVIVDAGQFGQCGGFEGACDETGTQRRTQVVCQSGREVERADSQACERDTDGVVIDAGQFGQCGGFEGRCDETGTQERTQVVCRDGQEAQRVENRDCARDTDGVVVEEGQFGQCGGFGDACDETGVQERALVVCRDGQEADQIDRQDCERDTDGVVVDEGQFGRCEGFEGICDETGTQTRTQTICRGGQANEEDITQACERDTDGIVVEAGPFGECGGFGGICDETGNQERTTVICRGGQETDEVERRECERDTDGVVVEEGQFGQCGGFEGRCDETGTQTRTDIVCRGGEQAEITQTQDCARDTDGIVIQTGQFGECGGFVDVCDETGTQTRTNIVCEGGQETEERQTQDCARDTDGVVVEEGQFGRCEGFEGRCGEEGTQSRTNTICRDGQQTEQTQTEACFRDTDGAVVSVGEPGECGGFEDPCDEEGVAERTDIICRDGQEAEVTAEEACERDTDGTIVDEGQFGECDNFEGRCGEEGTQTRLQLICRDGAQTEVPNTEVCFRDTDGVIVEAGQFGRCQGFQDACDETGTQTRTNIVCEGGQETEARQTQDCERDTDGVVVDEGQFGECGGFEDRCDETGTQTRTSVICRDGQQTPQTQTQDCARDTDGTIIDEGQFGECGGFEGRCDEEGVQTRTQTVCRGGQAAEQTQSEVCFRDTDGVIVNQGQFGECGGFEDACDETGTQSRDVAICRDGQVAGEVQTQDCVRDTDGVIVDTTPFSECGGFDDECDETGTQTRRVTTCRQGQPVTASESQDCTRQVEGCEEPKRCENDDQFESNEDFEEASFIEAGATSAFLCRTDFQQTQEADFYRFTVPENALLDVQVRYDHGVAPFLGIVLYGPGGQNDVRDFLFPDFEDPNTDVLQGERPIPVDARSAGEWFLEISGTEEGQDLDYEIILTIEFEEPPPQNCDELGQDIWEANDSCRTATRLPLDLDNCRPGSAGCTCNEEQACDSPLSCVSGVCQTGFICGPSQDEDHFLVTVNEGQDLTIRLPHFHFEGNIDMEVYEPDFQTLAGFSYNAGPNFEEVTIEGAVGGDYCIRIFSLSNFTTNSYSIETNTGIRQ